MPKPSQGPNSEIRIMFNYYNVEEVLPSIVLNLIKEIYDLLGNPEV